MLLLSGSSGAFSHCAIERFCTGIPGSMTSGHRESYVSVEPLRMDFDHVT